jgi:hypothetical protein
MTQYSIKSKGGDGKAAAKSSTMPTYKGSQRRTFWRQHNNPTPGGMNLYQEMAPVWITAETFGVGSRLEPFLSALNGHPILSKLTQFACFDNIYCIFAPWIITQTVRNT